MKVLLAAINSQYIHSNLAVRYLKTYTKDLDYECVINEFTINDRVEKILEKIVLQNPDIVAFSCYIWNIEYVQRLTKLIKAVNDKIEIIYGGPEVSYDAVDFLKENCGDYVIEGEGEETYRELIESKITIFNNYQNNTKKYIDNCYIQKIKGLYYKGTDEIKYTGFRKYMNMDKIVFPYTENDNLENKIVYYEASRGCPFRCKYCLSSTIRNVRFRNIELVKKELKFLIDKKVRLIKFVDRTFNCNIKFAMEIWRFLIDQNTDTKFHFEISADILKKEEIELLSNAPVERFQFEVGVQTTNNDVLKNINRNVDFEDIVEKVEEVKHIKNIKQHLDLIAGLPGEDFNSFVKSFNDVYKLKPEEIQLGFLKLLKGSDMRKEAEKWEMKFSPYPPYEILNTKHITYGELVILKRVEKMVDKYYNTQKFNNIISYFNNKFKTPFDFYKSLAEFYFIKGYFDRNLSSADYYKVFLEFNIEVLKEDNKVLKEIIKYDYLVYNKKKWIPEFLDRDLDKVISKKIKNSLKNISTVNLSENFHIEKFNIDILKYIYDGKIITNDAYVVFDDKNSNKIYDLSKLIDKDSVVQ